MESKQSNIFRNRVVQVILLSGLFLQIGIWVRNFAVLLFVVDKTNGDAFAVSMISVAEYAPIFIFSFIGGTFADRWQPKRTMIWCDVLSAISVYAVLFTLAFGSWKTVFYVTLISAILSQFSQPSGMKLFKMHLSVEQIQLGISAYQTMFAVFMILGPVLGTFVYQGLGIHGAIAITGLAFILSAAALLFLPSEQLTAGERSGSTLREEMISGIRYLREKETLVLIGAVFTAAGLAIGLTQPLGVFIVTEQLGLAKEQLQWLLMANGGGMVLGGALAMAMARTRTITPKRMVALGTIAFVVGFAVIGLSTILWLTLLAQFFVGLLLPCLQIGINTLILQNTDQAYVGRVNGILTPLFTGSMVVTMSIAGVLKQFLSLPVLYGIAALLCALSFIPIYRLPKTDATEEVPSEGN